MSGIGNIFGGLFGGSKPAPVATPIPITPPPVVTPSPPKQAPAPTLPAKPVTPEGYLKGADIYHENSVPDLTQLGFIIHKATEGTNVTDPLFASRWALFKKAGITRGAYHFFHPGQDPVAQAEHFVAVMGPLDAGDLPPSIDYEVDDGVADAKLYPAVKAFLDKVQALTGRIPMVYGPRSLLQDQTAFPANPPWALWQASANPPPKPWTSWTFWQDGELTGGIDLDYFKGDSVALAKFIDSTKV